MLLLRMVKSLNQHAIREMMIWSGTTHGLMVYLGFDIYNLLARKRLNGTWDEDKAIAFITKDYVPRVIKSYKKELGFLPSITSAEKKELGKQFMFELLLDGSPCLKRPPLDSLSPKDKINAKFIIWGVDRLSKNANEERRKVRDSVTTARLAPY
jgi:hypothetical protein